MVRSMISQTTLLNSFWDYALETAISILNMVPTKKVDKTPYEIWHGQASKLSYLKVWGCEALVKRDTLTKPDKLDPRYFKCIFVGYLKEIMGYSFYNPSENKVFVARNAELFENDLIDLKASGSVEDLELILEEDTNPSVDTSLDHEEDDQEINEPQSDINPIRKSSKTRCAPDRMRLYIDAEEHELGDLDNDVWVLVELPPNARTVSSKWLFKKKIDMDGAIYIFKAHLVAKGFTQTYGVDYEETFSLVTEIRAISILIAIAAYYDYEICLRRKKFCDAKDQSGRMHALLLHFRNALDIPLTQMTTSVGNNSVFRSFFEKQKLTGPNFIDWYRQLRLQVPPAAAAAHAAWVKGQKEVVVLMLLTMDLDIQWNLAHLGAYDMLQELKAMFSKQAEQELLQTVREFHACKLEEGQSVSSYVLKMKGYIDNLERLGQPVGQNLAVSLILVSLNKDYDSFVQNYNMHGMGKTVNELHAMLKLHEDTLPKKDANPALHAIRA
ncbi:retrotransposon protein, putative, ty1-copia subclass [Tanacetum coccineum]